MSESSLPLSSQDRVHPRLAEVVQRHLATTWRRPLRQFSEPAFEQVSEQLPAERPIILDAGCGTGWSTARLASTHPDCEVIGVDQSLDRLRRHPALPANAHLVRAELADFWRLARAAGWRLHRHYLLHPNPWPKAAQLKRRWHAHPVWPDLLALGGALELRTNFEIYAREFALALQLSGFTAQPELLSSSAENAASPFERKYLDSGHRIFRVSARLSEDQDDANQPPMPATRRKSDAYS